MLQLTRRVNEAVELRDTRTGEIIGTVIILGFTRAAVRVGFECPKHIAVVRDNAINRETRSMEDEDTEKTGQSGT
jgi:carbon storage regulator CsrA